MFSCDYANSTTATFDKELCGACENTHYVNNCSQRNQNCPQSTSDMWVQMFVPRVLDIPEQKPDLESITSVSTSMQIISQRVVKTPVVKGYFNINGQFIEGDEIDNSEGTRLTGRKLIIEGIIQQKVVYTSLTPEQSLHSATFAIPFSAIIIVNGDVPLTQKYQISAFLEDVFVCDISPRNLFSNNTVYIQATPVC